jgi:hypothetical protein
VAESRGSSSVVTGSDRAIELLEELVIWTRFTSREPFISALRSIVKDPKHWIAYEATDGVRSQSEVATFAGLSQPAISVLWARWRALGMVVDRGKRPMHLASPSDLGLEGPSSDGGAEGKPANGRPTRKAAGVTSG